ncbi:MAG: methyltransferase [Terriglobia bacterium]
MANNQKDSSAEMNLGALAQMNFSMAPTRMLLTAVQLGIFSHVAQGKTSIPEIAAASDSSVRGIRMLLDALCSIQLLMKRDGRYSLHPVAQQYLVRDSPDYMGYMFENDEIWDTWGRLTQAVRTGKPARQDRDGEVEEFFSVLVRSLHVMNREPARRLAALVSEEPEHKGMRVLDVACGSGVWGIALADADASARVTFQDLPNVLKVTRDYVERHRLTGRCDFLPGKLEEVEFGDSRFNLAVLGNICHSEGERASRHLFAAIHRTLHPGGRIAIVETMPNDGRTGRVFPLVFALNMLVHTGEGDTFTLAEYSKWLSEAGYSAITTADIGLNSPLILAAKE